MRFDIEYCPLCGGQPCGIVEIVRVVAPLIQDDRGEWDYAGDQESAVDWESSETFVNADGHVTIECGDCGARWDTNFTDDGEG